MTDERQSVWNQSPISRDKLRRGSLKGKKKIVIDDRTEVWVDRLTPPGKCKRIRIKYLEHIYGANWETLLNILK